MGGKADFDAGTPAGGAVERQFAAQDHGPLAHADQAQSAARRKSNSAVSIVAHFNTREQWLGERIIDFFERSR